MITLAMGLLVSIAAISIAIDIDTTAQLEREIAERKARAADEARRVAA